MQEELKPEFIRLYYTDFYTAVQGRSALFVGAYFVCVLAYLYDDCKGLEDDDQVLQSIARCSDEEWAKVGPIIFNREETGREFFRLRSGLWHQKRARGEFEAAQAQMEIYRSRAKMGGIAKAGKYGKKAALPPPKRC